MKILKFGGKFLANGDGLDTVLNIIRQEVENKEQVAVVVSARDNTTEELINLLEKSRKGIDYKADFHEFKKYQLHNFNENYRQEVSENFELLKKLLEEIALQGDYSLKIKDLVIAQGEIISAKLIAELLRQQGIKSPFVDSRDIFITDNEFGNAHIINELSEKKTKELFSEFFKDEVAVVTGLIASTEKGETTTLGRNGSNYSAVLLANYLNISEIKYYTP